MRFYFYSKYVYTDGDEKEVERDMHAAFRYFRGSNDHDEYEKWEIILSIYSDISP